jgi:hypothetical protein
MSVEAFWTDQHFQLFVLFRAIFIALFPRSTFYLISEITTTTRHGVSATSITGVTAPRVYQVRQTSSSSSSPSPSSPSSSARGCSSCWSLRNFQRKINNFRTHLVELSVSREQLQESTRVTTGKIQTGNRLLSRRKTLNLS